MSVAFLAAVVALLLGLGGLVAAFLKRSATQSGAGDGGGAQEVRRASDRRAQAGLVSVPRAGLPTRSFLYPHFSQVPLGVPLRPANRAVGDGMRRRRRRRAAAESDEEEEGEVSLPLLCRH